MNKYEKLRKKIEHTRSCVITTHENPDGDALGSEIAFHLYLTAKGVHSVIINSDLCPPDLNFMDDNSVLRTVEEEKFPSDTDTVFLLDTAVPSRIEKFSSEYSPNPSMIYAIDHHIPDRDSYAGTIAPGLSSTGELLYRYFNVIDMDISEKIAEHLLYAITTDTGWMRFSNTTPDILRIVAELSEISNIPLSKAHDMIYSNWSDDKFYLFIDVLRTLDIRKEEVAFIHCLQDMLNPYPSLENVSTATEVFITEVKKLKSCHIYLLLKQNPELNGFKVSLRSDNSVDVREIASQFGGGGHKAAAGCTVNIAEVEEAKNELLTHIKTKK